MVSCWLILMPFSIGQDRRDQARISAERDVRNLLAAGFAKASRRSYQVDLDYQIDEMLKDSVRVQTISNNVVRVTTGSGTRSDVGLYTFLDILGYRFYGPEDHWTFIPALAFPLPKFDTIVVCRFPYQRLAPSFGVRNARIRSLDTTEILWNRWQKRLRFSNTLNIPSGHYGSNFNKKYKSKIVANPEWRGEWKGSRQDWSANLKLCYSHPEVIRLYIEDAKRRLTNLMEKNPPPYVISMEPPDGGNHCACEKCQESGSVSDRVYGLAVQVVEALSVMSEQVYVSLYGYNEHASPPSFMLPENIIVGIAPFAFQSVGSPEVMMSQWEKSGARLFLRDYLAIPVWVMDQCSYQPDSKTLRRIDHLKEAQYLGFHIETTVSSMATGLDFYLISQASWSQADAMQEFRLFLDNMFPGFQNDLALIYQNLQGIDLSSLPDAHNRIKNLLISTREDGEDGLAQRLDDLRFYIEYLYLYKIYQQNNTAEDLEKILDVIMSEPAARLLHPWGLYRVLQRKEDSIRSFSRSEYHSIERIRTAGDQVPMRARATNSSYRALNPDFIAPLDEFPVIPVRNMTGILYVGNSGEGLVKFRTKLKASNSSASGVIIIRDLEDNHIEDLPMTPDNEWRLLSTALPRNQFYRVTFRTRGSELQLQGPDRPFAFDKKLPNRFIYKKVPFFIFVPGNVDSVLASIPAKSKEVEVLSDSSRILSDNRTEAYTIEVPVPENRKLEFRMLREGLEVLNFQHLLSLHSKALITTN